MKKAEFSPGDRVRIDAAYWDAELAGRTATVAPYPDGVTPTDANAIWVRFDVEEWKPGVVEGAEIDKDALHRI